MDIVDIEKYCNHQIGFIINLIGLERAKELIENSSSSGVNQKCIVQSMMNISKEFLEHTSRLNKPIGIRSKTYESCIVDMLSKEIVCVICKKVISSDRVTRDSTCLACAVGSGPRVYIPEPNIENQSFQNLKVDAAKKEARIRNEKN
jgi:hypothetical protein